jgi:short-subunit dehydrogenase
LILGATSAIAIATCRQLAARKASFYLVARSESKLQAVAGDLLTRGASAVTVKLIDLDDTAQHPQMLESAVAALGQIDLALIAHGVLGDQEQAQADYSFTEPILRTNLLSPSPCAPGSAITLRPSAAAFWR